jgi:carbon storage regulator CsrA
VSLVLNRKPGQAIELGEDIVIEVVETHRSWVSLRITAPPAMPILRRELKPKPNPAE